MKKYLFLVVSMLLVGCGYQADNKKLIFSEGVSEELLKIYELKDGSIVYSQFLDIDYKDSKTEQIKFSKALKKNKITIDEIISKNSRVDYANDGGSSLYTFENNELSDTDFYILKCKKNNQGINNIIIGNETTITNGCIDYSKVDFK